MPPRRLTVPMPFHTPFYTPLAAGASLGHFADEGLEVTVTPAAALGKSTVEALQDGSVEIALSGIMRSLVLADGDGPIIVHFAEVCSKNGFFLLSRTPAPSFRWADLVGRTVVSFAEAPTPWQCMLTVLREHQVDATKVRIERTRPAAEAVGAFLAGHGDYLEQTQPVVDQLLDAGSAHLAASMGEAAGTIPFTSYMTTPGFLQREPGVVARFTRAVYRTQRWLASHGPAEIAAAVASTFPETAPALMQRIVARYVAQDTWARDPIVRRAGYDRLQEILLHGGLIRRRHRYEDLIDTAFADAAISANGG